MISNTVIYHVSYRIFAASAIASAAATDNFWLRLIWVLFAGWWWEQGDTMDRRRLFLEMKAIAQEMTKLIEEQKNDGSNT